MAKPTGNPNGRPLMTYIWGDKTFLTDGKSVWEYDGETIKQTVAHIPAISITGADIEETRDLPLTNRVRIESSDGNTYTGDLIKWTKQSIKIKLGDGTAMRFKTD